MALIESDIDLSPISADDIPEGMVLVSEAGWNQTAADWRYMLSAGRGLGIRDDAGRLIASSMVLPYRPGIGWIGMVLVAQAHRRRGHATRLLESAIAYCRHERLTPMLDATPAGREVYRRLGFTDGEAIERWRGQGGGGAAFDAPANLERACEIDRDGFGADRSALLTDLAQREGALSLQLNGAILLGRRGRSATQLGPLLSTDEIAALALCVRAIDSTADQLLIDVPARERALRSMLQSRGFVVERPFTRMSLGASSPMGNAMRAIAGPELG